MSEFQKGPFFRVEKIPTREIEGSLQGLAPLKDETFLYLLGRATEGKLPVYFAAVPFHLVRPYDVAYDPRKHPLGRAVVDQILSEWQQGRFSFSWVYPDQDYFVSSDNYIEYFAAVEGRPDYLPCLVLGQTDHPDLRDVQGPLSVEQVKQHLGFA